MADLTSKKIESIKPEKAEKEVKKPEATIKPAKVKDTVKVEFIKSIRFWDCGKVVTYKKKQVVEIPLRWKEMLVSREAIRVI